MEEVIVPRTIELIKAILDEKGLSYKDLAERMELSAPRISRIMSGKRNITLKTLERIGEALGEEFYVTVVETIIEADHSLEQPNLTRRLRAC